MNIKSTRRTPAMEAIINKTVSKEAGKKPVELTTITHVAEIVTSLVTNHTVVKEADKPETISTRLRKTTELR
jgi:hypothetical protein